MTAAEQIRERRPADHLRDWVAGTGERWLISLVHSVIAAGGVPKSAILDRIFACFLDEYGLGETGVIPPTVSPVETPDKTRALELKAIVHGTGVNALRDGAELVFHPRLTVIYGRNGSGKSGFVRILKRLAGSKTQEDIWQDVHKRKSTNNCSATVSYSLGGTDATFDWSGERSVTPFRDIGVFDGKSISIHLTKSLTFTYQPQGFALFEAVSAALQGLQDRLTSAINARRSQQPSLLFCNQASTPGKFLARLDAKTSASEIDAVATWGTATAKQLVDIQKQRSALTNVDANKELLTGRLAKLVALEQAVHQAATDLSARNLRSYGALAKRVTSLKARKAAQKGKTLEDYPIENRDSVEWETFIEAGEEYIAISHESSYPGPTDACIYCHQPLGKSAQKLVQLYRELQRTEDSVNLDEAQSQLDSLIDDLKATSYVDDVPFGVDEYTPFLPKADVNKTFRALAAASNVARGAARVLSGQSNGQMESPDLSPIATTLAQSKSKVNEELKALAQSQREIRIRAAELDRQILDLQDRQKLHKRRADVDEYIAAARWIAKATPLSTKFRTKPITDLAKLAWEELVSETFQARFALECKALQTPTVALGFRGEYGSQLRDKSVEGLTEIEELLSEGEQKAVALADFLADEGMRQQRTPLVFDDPANSFDHERKQHIAKRLVDESGERQVIVFTHDLVFASYLHGLVEELKNRELDKQRASFHNVSSEGGRVGVVVRDYYPGTTKFDAAVKKIEAKLPRLASLKGQQQAEEIAVTYSLLRQAVEKAVEERIFGGVVSRWRDQIQLHSVPRASLNRDKLDRAKALHEDFSRYIEAHNQSDEMIQHSRPSLEQLKADISAVKDIAASS